MEVSTLEGSANPIQGEVQIKLHQGERVEKLLGERPDLISHPRRVAIQLGISEGSAKRLCKKYRDARQGGLQVLLGPPRLQNLHYVGRTPPDTVPYRSPPTDGPLTRLGPWKDRGDGKLTVTRDLPAQPGAKVEVRLSRSNPTIEVHIAAPMGLSPYEVLLVLHLLDLPFDREAPGSLSFEVFRDGDRARFEGVEARTYETVETWLLKLYNHHDERGPVARVEVRTPPVGLCFREIEAFLMGKQPLGRDAKIERLTDMVEDNSRGLVEVMRRLARVEKVVAAKDPKGLREEELKEELGRSMGRRRVKEPALTVKQSDAVVEENLSGAKYSIHGGEQYGGRGRPKSPPAAIT